MAYCPALATSQHCKLFIHCLACDLYRQFVNNLVQQAAMACLLLFDLIPGPFLCADVASVASLDTIARAAQTRIQLSQHKRRFHGNSGAGFRQNPAHLPKPTHEMLLMPSRTAQEMMHPNLLSMLKRS